MARNGHGTGPRRAPRWRGRRSQPQQNLVRHGRCAAPSRGDHGPVLEILFVDIDPDLLGDLTVVGRVLSIVRRDDGTTETYGDVGVVEELDSGSRLFVDAWQAHKPAATERPGDGLPWDSPGFTPPDRPPP